MGGLIHILLVIAIVVVLVRIMPRRKPIQGADPVHAATQFLTLVAPVASWRRLRAGGALGAVIGNQMDQQAKSI